MSPEYPLAYEPATPEYVFAVLSVGWDFLKWETTLVDLALAINDLAWANAKLLADCLNPAFRINVSLGEWQAAFPNLSDRTVRDLCEFLALHVRRPVIQPWRSPAGDCFPAGAFLTVRSLLVRLGAAPDLIKPSTALEPFLRQYADKLLWEFELLAPGRLPHYYERRPLNSAGWYVIVCSLGLLLLGWAAAKWMPVQQLTLSLLGLGCLGISLGLLFSALGSVLPPRQTSFGDLRTFGDLAYFLVGQQPRPRIQPTA